MLRALDDHNEVWKIPAIWNDLLPTPVSVRSFSPEQRWKDWVWQRIVPLIPEPVAPLLLDRLHAHLARQRRRRFNDSLGIIQRLHEARCDTGLLPCRIDHGRDLVVCTPYGDRQYHGPVLVQQRADVFHVGVPEPGFDWNAVVAIQQSLWRQGAGLDDGAAVLGPHDWATLGGRIFLGDTGSLTAVRAHARRTLAPAVLDRTSRRLLKRCHDPVTRARAAEYVARVRAQLTQHEFDRIWPA